MFGKYTLIYTPDEVNTGECSVEISFSGEALIPEFLTYVEKFLMANGYLVTPGSIQFVEGEE